MSGFRVIQSGVLMQLQDRGRFGYGDIGVTQSGVADRYSASWANRLLFNHPNDILIEILLGGVKLISELDTYISLTGAQCSLQINGTPQPLWRVHHISRGDTIEIGMAREGLRLYLATKGGFESKSELGSSATTLKEGFGHQIVSGELLPCQSHTSSPLASTPQSQIPTYGNSMTLRVLLGYQSDMFELAQREIFFSTTYRVTQATDRMGCRLEGTPIAYSGGELISEPIAYGSIQIPTDGQPIILLNERQTIGGYPKIGSLIPQDCYKLAQARPNTQIRFREVGLEEAIVLSRL